MTSQHPRCTCEGGRGRHSPATCPHCLNVRCRVIEKVGIDFPALGAETQLWITQNV